MRIEKTAMGDVVLLKVSGSILFMDTSTLKSLLHRLVVQGKSKIVVDCSEMDSINSQVLAMFIKTYQTIEEGHVAFANPNQHVRQVFQSTHLDSRFPLYNSVQEAMNDMRP